MLQSLSVGLADKTHLFIGSLAQKKRRGSLHILPVCVCLTCSPSQRLYMYRVTSRDGSPPPTHWRPPTRLQPATEALFSLHRSKFNFNWSLSYQIQGDQSLRIRFWIGLCTQLPSDFRWLTVRTCRRFQYCITNTVSSYVPAFQKLSHQSGVTSVNYDLTYYWGCARIWVVWYHQVTSKSRTSFQETVLRQSWVKLRLKSCRAKTAFS